MKPNARLYRFPAIDERGTFAVVVPHTSTATDDQYTGAARYGALAQGYPLPPVGLPAGVIWEDVHLDGDTVTRPPFATEP